MRQLAGVFVLSFASCLGATAISAESKSDDEVVKLAAAIDAHISKRLDEENVTPAPLADDAEFLRRVYIDIAGKIPPASEVRRFLADESPQKRREVVNRLLETPAYVTNFTNMWRNVLMPEANADFQVRFLLPSFEAWLREKLMEDVNYDAMVREILTMPLDSGRNRNRNQALLAMQSGQATPLVFYQAKQVAPENLAAATSRMFLGIRIECAQCHDHPFDKWKRDDFWSFAAFYAGIERQGQQGIFGQVRELMDRRELAIPDTDKVVQAVYLDGSEPQWRFRVGARTTLAEWVTDKENPYFKRAAANRFWAHFFGIGIVDPVDDFSADNPPSHPELLTTLADAFAENDFDMKFLIRAITASETYQRSSQETHESQSDARLFSRMAVKGMTPEQLFASVSQAIGYYSPYQPQQRFVIGGNNPEGEFRELFSNDNVPPTETQTTILQSLALMNGRIVAGATNLQSSTTLAAVAEYPLMNTKERIETLFLSSLSRQPTDPELSKLVNYVDSGGPKKDSKQALGDVFWALLNSSEFMFNH